ncbi:MAG TPA: LysR substrate-binding domain-containing protein, partial [Polyangiales bacterium]|nr:LysR substrate-binding domain-containing protein [Polyangiales bacterium]
NDPLSGSLKIGVIPTVGPYLLPDVAPELRQRFPKLSLVWLEEKTSSLLEKLQRAELDAAIVALEPSLSQQPHVVLGVDEFVFAAAPEHALSKLKRRMRPEELEQEHVLLLDDGHCFRDQALSLCTRVGAEEAPFRATSLSTLVQMTAAGRNVTLLPSLALPVENRSGALSIREFVKDPPTRTLILLFRKNSSRESALQAVGDSIHRTFASKSRRLGNGAKRE